MEISGDTAITWSCPLEHRSLPTRIVRAVGLEGELQLDEQKDYFQIPLA
jgi:hypothetical protein